jgi:Zn-dependent protease with chaperone function
MTDPVDDGLPSMRWGCPCHAPSYTDTGRWTRRGFAALVTSAAVGSAQAMEECRRSGFTKAVPAGQVEGSARQQYAQMLQEAGSKKALASADHPQLKRLNYIADRMIPLTRECNERAAQWKWEVNLLGSPELNAFCMPGGKIAFYYGILARLQLSDDEVAVIMGHEIAHALLEHAREQMGKNTVTQGGLRLGAALLGLGDLGDMAARLGSQLLSLTYSRQDESEADALGLVLSSRAGYKPEAGVTLWKKMMAESGGKSPPKILSTHPTNGDRIRDIEARLVRLNPVYDAADKPDQSFGPPPPMKAS